ncbi:MAG: LysR family substrate-binding domain-containing protein [Faecousia sp.]
MTSNTVELTEAAEQLMPGLHRLLEDYEQLLQQAGTSSKPIRLVLGLDRYVFSSASKGQLIGQMCMKHPRTELVMEELLPSVQVEALMRGKIDAMLYTHLENRGDAPYHIAEDELLRWSYLGSEDLCIAMSEKDPLAQRPAVSMAELADYTFVFNRDILRSFNPNETGDRANAFVKCCLDAGFTPQICTVGMHLADIKSQLTALGRGIYPSTVPFFLRDYPGIRFVPLKKPPHSVQYYVLSLKTNRNPGIQRLTVFLREQFAARQKDCSIPPLHPADKP